MPKSSSQFLSCVDDEIITTCILALSSILFSFSLSFFCSGSRACRRLIDYVFQHRKDDFTPLETIPKFLGVIGIDPFRARRGGPRAESEGLHLARTLLLAFRYDQYAYERGLGSTIGGSLCDHEDWNLLFRHSQLELSILRAEYLRWCRNQFPWALREALQNSKVRFLIWVEPVSFVSILFLGAFPWSSFLSFVPRTVIHKVCPEPSIQILITGDYPIRKAIPPDSGGVL
ncbi:hypothetical protein Tco_0348490 [Tanacetum coccineum]